MPARLSPRSHGAASRLLRCEATVSPNIPDANRMISRHSLRRSGGGLYQLLHELLVLGLLFASGSGLHHLLASSRVYRRNSSVFSTISAPKSSAI
jgi:hypothetical protein